MVKTIKVPVVVLVVGAALVGYYLWTRYEPFYNYGAPPGFSNASPYLLRAPPHPMPNDVLPFPNLSLPSHVVGGGGRRGALMGGSQINLPNVLPPIDISDRNIAPINIATSFPLDMPSSQIGVMYKIFGDHNDVHPLYGRRSDRHRWEYHTIINGVRVPVEHDRHNDEVGSNDTVHMNGHDFRVTKYNSSLQYRL